MNRAVKFHKGAVDQKIKLKSQLLRKNRKGEKFKIKKKNLKETKQTR